MAGGSKTPPRQNRFTHGGNESKRTAAITTDAKLIPGAGMSTILNAAGLQQQQPDDNDSKLLLDGLLLIVIVCVVSSLAGL